MDLAGQGAVRPERVVAHLAPDVAGHHLPVAGDSALLESFEPDECSNYFRHAGYGST